VSEFRDPPIPADLDLREHSTGRPLPPMPIDASGDVLVDWALAEPLVVRARVLLMVAAWRQNPTASLPDHVKLWNIAQVTARYWRLHEADILADWMRCSDGRIYHIALSAHALRLWQLRNSTRRMLLAAPAEWAALRRSIFERDDFTCRYCSAKGGRLECDHVHPISRGGTDDPENLVTACFDCNRSKGAKTLAEWTGAR
jgi:hypothetical protein